MIFKVPKPSSTSSGKVTSKDSKSKDSKSKDTSKETTNGTE
jgi:hypothetical protein